MARIHEALGALAAVAAGVYQSSGYNGLGGLGYARRRRKRKERSTKYLRNLPLDLQEIAKTDAKLVRENLKTAQEQAWMEFYSKYPGAIPVEMRKIDRVVARFLMGQSETGVSPYVQSVSDGRATRLIVQGREVAVKDSPFARFVKICPGSFGAGKADRAAANSALRMLQAGISVADRKGTNESSGRVFLAPTGKAGRIVAESCMLVEVNQKVRNAANAYAQVYRPSAINPNGGGTFVPPAAPSSYGPDSAWYRDMQARAKSVMDNYEDPAEVSERNRFNGMRYR